LDNAWSGVTRADISELRETRRYSEGIATSHFYSDHRRDTGVDVPVTGPVGVILGDSYVEATEVPDRETLGAVLALLLAARGDRTRVAQYGWSGADTPRYLVEAADLDRVWHPRWVVVVMTVNDLGPDLASGPARLVPWKDHSWGSVVPPVVPRRGFAKFAETAMRGSVVAYELVKRFETSVPQTLGGGGLEPAQTGPVSALPSGLSLPLRARIALEALRSVYGERLRILFIANVGLDGLRPPTPAEEVVLAACGSLGIRCADTRALMAEDRRDSLRLSRGFVNSAPGAGHINAVGHALAARTIAADLVP
jgi:hypothetical protein